MRKDETKELKDFISETFGNRYDEDHSAIGEIRDDITEIKIGMAKITTAYKVFIAIGSAVGVIIGFCVELFYRST
jgi:hypothetical protein